MKQVISGFGVDVTSTVLTWLRTNQNIHLATLYLIGEPEDPLSFWMTDWESPLFWTLWGKFQPAVIERGDVTCEIGLKVQTLDVTWSPVPPVTLDIANPYRRVMAKWFDNQVFRSWTVYMPTPGDADTYGCSELFGGRIASATIDRGKIKFTVNSFLDVVNQQIPMNTIELSSTLASYTGAVPPAGVSRIPQFNIIAGSTPGVLIADCTSPTAHYIFADNKLQNGFLVFNQGAGMTLPGVWSAIAKNVRVTIAGTDYNEIHLFTPTPWAPTPGTDTCFASGAAPINQADGDYLGFPYVPAPESAV